MHKQWWHNAVVYQIYPRSFCDSNGDGVGDIPGIITKLPYLQKLGIDVIWLSPVCKSPMEDNGYDISDYQDIAPEFGKLEDMFELLRQARNHGIRILMDLVVNHSSDQHPWFIESKSSRTSPYRDYYVWRDQPTNDIKSIFGGEAWEYDEATGQYYFHFFAKGQPDLNWEHEPMVRDIFSMINFWLDHGVGGFRLDVIDMLGKEIDRGILGNGSRLHDILKRMNHETFGKHDVLTVGETWGATPEIAKLYSNPARQELSMIFQFEHIQLDWGALGKWQPIPLDFVCFKSILAKWQTELKGEAWNSLFWNNHDLPRVVSRWGDDGEHRVQSAKMLAMVLHLMQGTPYIYQGEELGMTNVRFPKLEDYNDVEIHGSYRDLVLRDKKLSHDEFMHGVYRMGRDNARTPFQWSAQAQAGFTTGKPWLMVNPNYTKINAEAALADPDSIFYTYQALIALRKGQEFGDLIVYGDFELLMPEHPSLFVYRRFTKPAQPSLGGKQDQISTEILVVANFGSQPQRCSLSWNPSRVLVSNYPDPPSRLTELSLRPWEAVVYTGRS